MITKHDHVRRQTCADTTILKNHFGFKENSHLVAHTYCEVDYFRKDPDSSTSHQVKS